MCSWAPYLFDYKPRFIKFFSSFHAAYNHGRLTFFILLFYRKLWMTLSLFLATFCRPNYSFAFDFLQHHVHIRHRRGYVTSFWIVCVHIFAFCNLIYWHVPCTYLVFQFVHFCGFFDPVYFKTTINHKNSCCSGASINDTGNARVRERRECISEASVTYVQVRFTVKGSLH